ncbi:hypothetical protein FSP39_005652 [Pinctada imbricata]|uniref:RRM domain-containing protein n=1 Tax=Pinctada imbricata TaxID=66713 RepID=A0AA88XQ16_PINIB|nr:hypothetical protein FSP39_005652 [Pinctada imbricata]
MSDEFAYDQQPNGDEQQLDQQVEPMEGDESAANAGGDGTQEDDDDRKIFVGNLSWETTQKDLKDYFSTYGEVTNCTLKTDLETRRSRGFGFVVFKEVAVVDKVLSEKEHKLGGRTIDPKRANPRKAPDIIKKIFCGKVDPSVSEDEIKEYFSKFGEIKKVELPFDKMKDQRRAFCFVEFDTEESVKKVLDETTHKLGSNEVDVKKATPNNQNKRGRGGFGPWGYGGNRGGRGGWNQGYNQYGYGNQGYGQYGNYGGYGYDSNYYPGYGAGGWEGYGGYDQYNYGGNYYGYGGESANPGEWGILVGSGEWEFTQVNGWISSGSHFSGEWDISNLLNYHCTSLSKFRFFNSTKRRLNV